MSETKKLKAWRWAWLVLAGFLAMCWLVEAYLMGQAASVSEWGQVIWRGITGVCCFIGFRSAWEQSVKAYNKIKESEQ